jgi:hypothetical protein
MVFPSASIFGFGGIPLFGKVPNAINSTYAPNSLAPGSAFGSSNNLSLINFS